MSLVYIGLGGFLGAISRYLISKYINTHFPLSNMPYGTLFVNLIGAFILSLLMSLSIHKLEMPKILCCFLPPVLSVLLQHSPLSYMKL